MLEMFTRFVRDCRRSLNSSSAGDGTRGEAMKLDPAQMADGTLKVNETNDVILVSDLHLADGRREPFGKFTHGENFFWDESFARFLKKISGEANGRSQTLVSNGDFLDFLRVDRIPHRAAVEDTPLVFWWRQFLQDINHPAALNDLFAADRSERVYGFKTQDHKCIWKLLLIFDGHQPFFDALRELEPMIFFRKEDE
jgi:hypothetical protein